MSHPTTMLAAVLRAPGSPLVLERVSRPILGSKEVLVHIKASGVSPLDVKIAAGKADHAQVVLPAILGVELAGVVEEVGREVKTFRIGDEVYGLTGGVGGHPGSLAEFAAVDALLLAIKPRNLSMRAAAVVPLNFITAWEGLVDRAGIREGRPVLIHGGAGGVGHLAVQIARAFGATVYATGSAAQSAEIQSYGATAIDNKTESVEQYVARCTQGEGFDVVYDTVGGTTLDDSFRAVRNYHGHVVSCLGWGTHALAPLSFRAATYSGVFSLLPLLSGKERAHHGEIMTEATKLIEAGKVKVRVNPQFYSLATANDAHLAVALGKSEGKRVVEVA